VDVCCATTCTTTSNLPDRINGLRNIFAEDGVHLTPNGYNNLAKRTISCLKTLLVEKPKIEKKTYLFLERLS
jgi:lysophospholipase L1-like esterase